MCNKIKKIIPWASFAAILIAALILFFCSANRVSLLVESPETRAAAEETLNQITANKPQTLDDTAFMNVLKQADEMPYIAQVWLFAPDGKIIYSKGTPLDAESATQLATRQVKGALAALPVGELTQEQQMLLLVGSAIQAEGEHNDVFRYMVRPLTTLENKVIGYVGITYDVNEGISARPNIWQIVSMVGLLLCLVIYWVGLPLWTYLDAKERRERAPVWALFVLAGNLVALIAYLLVRNPSAQ